MTTYPIDRGADHWTTPLKRGERYSGLCAWLVTERPLALHPLTRTPKTYTIV
jgi:hypothetical protein